MKSIGMLIFWWQERAVNIANSRLSLGGILWRYIYLSKNGMIEPKFEMALSTLAAFSLQDYYDHLDLHIFMLTTIV